MKDEKSHAELDSASMKEIPNHWERRQEAGKGAVPKVWGSLNYFKFTSEFKSAKI